ncbi:lysophospholipid acyltransferase family protein [Membranihabitans marinus]|uniref:lysophospholipid acyltransferase family protein n=1 Tax=Membranihabitans marinus TaxID=1227546 RepID=UPI001F3FACBA|nr:lysophospholipid acyltransferase family protein [Membranihabitans marinus]
MIGLFCYILHLLCLILITSKDNQEKIRSNQRKKFCQFANRIFGLEVRQSGEIPTSSSLLFVSNHRSFYDPIALLSIVSAHPVSKAEVRKYPLLGWGAELTGIILLNRHNRKERGLVKKSIQENLSQGINILLFPEGTTSAQSGLLPFKKGAFEAAIKANATIVPIAVEYYDNSLYWGEQTMWQHMTALLLHTSRENRYISIKIGEPIVAKDSKTLVEHTESTIWDQVEALRKERRQK